jgi:hypothetical protein
MLTSFLQAVACLNDMVTDALRHMPYCIEYLSNISDEQNFLFCAIPQVPLVHGCAFTNTNRIPEFACHVLCRVVCLF